ncbi:PQQ-dependent sugar dehydrogenase [Nitriliruptor alkaliphilus]|uniref:PQQ-dependent sugar dehydrogenase n=1 Tax=Nitriliruptor alkaliphilus TaxID=427918 RepID=UPI001B801FCB|nr:PQQ-dependent sugar dehydrogenase [Nitriliruptor alkaliphilus]
MTLTVTAAALLVVPLLTAPALAAPPRGTGNACPPGEVPDPGFGDADGPFRDAIHCVAWYGVTRGRTSTTYEPGSTLTRAQLASFTRSLLDVSLADGFPLGDGLTSFRDVDPAGPHAPAIDALASADPPVLRGYDEHTFGPGDRVTRAQAASIVDRALRLALPDLSVPADPDCRFRDRDRIPTAHRDAVERLCALGVAAGRDDGRFDPGSSILRGQAAAFLARTLDVVAEHGDLRPPYRVRTLASGLDQPWEVVRTPAGRTFVTERRGTLYEVVGGALEVRRTFPEVVQSGEGGLLGLALEPGGSRLYAYLTTTTDSRVVRFSPDSGAAPQVIVSGIPVTNTSGSFNSNHHGGRIAFGPDGHLYIGTGDAAPNSPAGNDSQQRAQDTSSLLGKILRVNADGSVPADNPFGNEVWSLGHRNVQGLAFDAAGRLWATEFGPERDDEVNLIDPGANYGWPLVTGTDTTDTAQGRSRPAVFVRQPPEASWSGATFTTENVGFAGRDTLLVAALRGQRLWRIGTDGAQVTGSRSFFVGDHGRLRTVVPSGDGGVLVLTGNGGGQDRLLRIGR